MFNLKSGKPLLVVEDSGPGVSEASAEDVDRFYTSSETHVKNASGLGLFICRQIIEAWVLLRWGSLRLEIWFCSF